MYRPQPKTDAEFDREAAELALTEVQLHLKEDGDPTPEMLAASEADRGVRTITEQPDWN